MLEEEQDVSALEVYLKAGEDIDDLQEELEDKLGNTFTVKNRIQQDQQLYKTLNIERWSIFFILTYSIMYFDYFVNFKSTKTLV